MDQQQFCLRWNNHGSTLVAVFDNLLASESLVDVTLFAEGHRLKAHKVVLSACSPYFQQVFAETQDRHPIVVLKDVGHVVLRALLEYMYRGEVNVAQDQLETLIRTAESLKIKGLADGTRGTPGLAPRGDTDPPSSPTSVPVTQVSSQGAPQGEACPGGIKEQRTPLGESRIAPRGERNDNYQLPQSSASSIPSVLSTVLTMPPALSLAAAAANAPLPTKIKLERPPPTAPQDAPPGSPLAKRRRKSPVPSYLKVRHCSGGRESAVDRDSGADSDGRSSSSPGDTLTHLPRIPATITPVAPLHYPLERPETAPSGTPGSSSPSPDSVGTRSDVQPSSPVPRPVSSLGHSSPPLFKARGRLDENSSDANHHSDDDGETLRQVKDHGDTAGPSTSRLSHDDGPHTPSYLGWPYPQDPPSSSEDPPSFPSLENTNQGIWKKNFLAPYFPPRPHPSLGPPFPGLYGPPPSSPWGGRSPPGPGVLGGGPGVLCAHECSRCSRLYKTRKGLKHHVKNECGVEPRFQCSHCDWRFKQKAHLLRHVARKHTAT
ncbi:protein tramtrack, beta isoform-like isoform X3 [Portunus trituberculatus]|uniref:protein tramtrack, beta isoform-like isoform X3 n=1 Tax=Portunus trituberculatus TaxID=210409 RepID=UPI001E1CC205|nr:protein tramtrack, beta isoform-like isoform X3 [Portunus trituberculatus]